MPDETKPVDPVSAPAPAPKADHFNRTYRELTTEEKSRIDQIKSKAEELYVLIDANQGRACAVAKTKLEESVMWAVKGIAS